jgi:5-(carboxyamino)imidazole ribonucleotide synthase
MLALAGYPLGLDFRHLSPDADAPAAPLSEHVRGDYQDPQALVAFARGLDVATYEFENVPAASVRLLQQRVPVHPPPRALEAAQDRLVEKRFFTELGIATAPFAAVDSPVELHDAIAHIGLPAVLKTRRWGYDGKGQALLRSTREADAAFHRMQPAPLILEGFVPFRRELSILGVRGPDGATAFYPLVQNRHGEGILRLSLAPAPALSDTLQRSAEDLAARVLDALDYVGVLALELFDGPDGLRANEMAPRVHNSGHWTIEGADTSQFENHLRAILGLPLGSTRVSRPVAMVNLIGEVPPLADMLAIPEAAVHLYGKEPRPRRKLGHVTLRADDADGLRERLVRMRRLHPGVGPEPGMPP